MAKVLIPLADGFEEIEALTVVDILRRAGIEVVLAGLHDGAIKSAHNVTIIPDATLDAINPTVFDMLILPGGQPGTENLNADPRIHKLIELFDSNDKMIGASHEDKPAVSNSRLITSEGPGNAISFGLEIVARLAGQDKASEIGKIMLVQESGHPMWNQQLFNSTVQALVGALEMKDTYTQGHAKRVTEFSLSIGAKLNLPVDEMRDLYLGAVLHDIGKIGTEEGVLNKPESLSRHEEMLVREHPLKGTLFIFGIDNLSNIIPTILHHHERWDGTGYPGHLKGQQIPLHARIVCIADAFDAMISNRSFRDGLEKNVAIRELIKHKNTQFDPFLVDVFIECLNDSPFETKDFSYYF